MSRAAVATASRELTAAREDPTRPVLIVVDASPPEEQIIRGQLSTLAFFMHAISSNHPALLLIRESSLPRATLFICLTGHPTADVSVLTRISAGF